MATETIIDNEFITMWYHHDTQIVHHVFHKFMYGEELRAALETGIEQIKKNGSNKWLSDDRFYTAIPKEDTEWGLANLAPMAISAGWKYWAIVLPKSTAGKMSFNRLIEKYKNLGVTAKIFANTNEAMAWLKSI